MIRHITDACNVIDNVFFRGNRRFSVRLLCTGQCSVPRLVKTPVCRRRRQIPRVQVVTVHLYDSPLAIAESHAVSQQLVHMALDKQTS